MADKVAYRVRHTFAREVDGQRVLYTNDNADEIATLSKAERTRLVERGYVEEYNPDEVTRFGTPVARGPLGPLAEPGVAGIDVSAEDASKLKGSSKGK